MCLQFSYTICKNQVDILNHYANSSKYEGLHAIILGGFTL